MQKVDLNWMLQCYLMFKVGLQEWIHEIIKVKNQHLLLLIAQKRSISVVAASTSLLGTFSPPPLLKVTYLPYDQWLLYFYC